MKIVHIFIFLHLFSITLFGQKQLSNQVIGVLQKDIIAQANWAMTQKPITITAEQCERSAGGLHDFYSEGDYWWKNPDDPNGPYIQRDGQTNLDNFVAHRKAMIRFSQIVGSLASAYLITKDEKYVKHAFLHINAWFIDKNTLMNPSLLYAQAIKGKATGRGIGIIDTIHLMEVAQGIIVMQKAASVDKNNLQIIKNWFAQYLAWLTTHQYGIDEREAKNNHGTCWVMQVASFAKLTENQALIDYCKTRFKTVLLPNQLVKDGSFPLELKRTKPYGYSIFNLDAMTTLCQILTDSKDDLWDFKLDDGRSMKKAIEFLYPYIENKSLWTYPKDVMYWEEWPVAQPFLLFGYQHFGNKNWFESWKKLEHFPKNDEVIRNLPIRNPLLWL
ncbi:MULTISPECIES: alginate lyase family protein [Emticicia]|uniref:alginate lyase family protein n=1 Tax=Emticicia TaxID=312278 RepID=UPI0007D8C429|nr:MULTISPECIES: alginate lyase family protein [Emticicia]